MLILQLFQSLSKLFQSLSKLFQSLSKLFQSLNKLFQSLNKLFQLLSQFPLRKAGDFWLKYVLIHGFDMNEDAVNIGDYLADLLGDAV